MNTTIEGCIYRMFENAQQRARRAKIAFTITRDDIFIPVICPLLNIPLVLGGGNIGRDNSPSLDRIDSTKGYTPDNVWVISGKANRFKNNATLEEFKTMTANWRRHSEGTKRVQGSDGARPRVDTGAKPMVRGGRTKRD